MRSHPILALCLVGPVSAQLAVTAVAPANNALAVPTAAGIRVDFDRPVDRGSVSSASFQVFGRWSGVVPGTFAFLNGDRSAAFSPSRPLFPGETVFVHLTSAVTANGGRESLTRGFDSQYWTRSAAGSRRFARTATLSVRNPGEGQIQTYGAYAGDLDGDGSPDMTLPNEIADDVRVMRNDGCGTFSRPAANPLPNGSVPSPIEGGDFNGDGLVDVAIANTRGDSVSVLLGNGDGTFQPAVTYPSGSATRGLGLLDVDADGDTDIVTANRNSSNLALHLNRGDGTFLPPTFFEGGGRAETGIAVADANGDGIFDLFVGHLSSQTVTLLLGDGAGNFTLSATQAVQGSPWMIVAGDVDGDGHADVAVCNSNRSSASIVRGDGAGGLLPATHYAAGGFPLAIDLGDLDGDGHLDLAVSNYSGRDYTVYFNDGAGRFVAPFTLTTTGAGSCMLVVDHDRDGDMDLLAIDEIDDVVHIFTQTGPAPAGVQPPDCGATLRVDNFANRNGYGGAPGHAVDAGSVLFLGISGPSNQPFLAMLGSPLEPGASTPFGLLNLGNPAELTGVLATDAHGEALRSFPIPAALPPGLGFALQAVVADPGHPQGLRLSNPESVVIR